MRRWFRKPEVQALHIYLEIGDRSAGDEVIYPNDDLTAALGPDGKWVFAHKDGRLY